MVFICHQELKQYAVKEITFLVIVWLEEDTIEKTPKLTTTFGNVYQALPTTICKILQFVGVTSDCIRITKDKYNTIITLTLYY